jgi:hypothetical protein
MSLAFQGVTKGNLGGRSRYFNHIHHFRLTVKLTVQTIPDDKKLLSDLMQRGPKESIISHGLTIEWE